MDNEKLISRINSLLIKNKSLTKEARTEFEKYAKEISKGASPDRLNEINKKLTETENSMRGLHRLGTFFKKQMSQAAESFSKWFSAGSVVKSLIAQTENAISEIQQMDTLLTRISAKNDALSDSALKNIADNAFDVAGRYGKKAADYLSGVQEASHAGYRNSDEIAELSIAAQSTGDMTAELANQMIFAADRAYQMNGSVAELTKMLDGMNYITDHNAVSMTQLAEGMSIVGDTAASFGVDVRETTAALAAMITATHKGGSDVAQALKDILLYISQVSDAERGIDAKGLARYEAACSALNVKLKETKNGVLSLRDPMEVLKELAAAYNRLDETDTRRNALLGAMGTASQATLLDVLLSQWDTYEAMLKQYTDGSGSMAKEAERMADTWEGSLNRLSNTWTATIENVVNSDAVSAAINVLNGLLSVVNTLTDALGPLGSIGLGAGITSFVKNFA
ncbi:MAG: phage tail tape measure protein [Lachnospiraceae bacterium]|nr:phage tail tape measure protein [Lachnospiraceae bacterium]